MTRCRWIAGLSAVALMAVAAPAAAQHTGTLQVTARVVDIRESWSAFQNSAELVRRLGFRPAAAVASAPVPVQSNLVTLTTPDPVLSEPTHSGQLRVIRIDYLKN